MASTRKKLEDVYSGLSPAARAWLLNGKITLKDAELITEEEMSEQEALEWIQRFRINKRWIWDQCACIKAITDLSGLIDDILAYEAVNAFSTEQFLIGDLTLEQMRYACLKMMGRRSVRMFTLLNYPGMVQERRNLAYDARRKAAKRRPVRAKSSSRQWDHFLRHHHTQVRVGDTAIFI